jgi:hypothetical protein
MYKKITAFVLALMLSFGLYTPLAEAKVKVRGYVTKNGTYVSPHYRTNPDKKYYNNWSSKGNINPYTGKVGYKNYKKR